MVVALLALFVAMGGGAYAAFKVPNNSVGSKQIKADAVSSGKVKNRSLLADDFKAGQLPAGPKGDQGIQGLQGIQGVKGDPGPVTGVLPSGASETGAFVARDRHARAGEVLDIAISFPLRLSAGVPAFYVVSGGPPVPQCAGSAANPTAASRSLCVYEAVQGNTAGAANAPAFIDPTTTLSTDATQPFGVILRAFSFSSGDAYIYGSWAVTAP
jgi:hypothetical protein